MNARGSSVAMRIAGLFVAGLLLPAAGLGQWTQWGGPTRDFVCHDVGKLAASWPEGGPPKLWERPLHEGYTSILCDDGVLYTMCYEGDPQTDGKEVVLAIDAKTGKTRWETKYDAPSKPDMRPDFGPGPMSTPLIVDGRIFAVGATCKFHCLDQKTGKILWGHDLMEEMGASHMGFGYGASPLAWKDNVLLSVGGETGAVVAFDQKTGKVKWKSEKVGSAYASPQIAKVAGEPQIIAVLGKQVVGLNPDTGKTLWQADIKEQSTLSTPIWDANDQVLFVSAAYGGGSQAFKLNKTDDGFKPEELFYSRKLRVQHGTMIRVGDMVYGSSGDFGPVMMCAMDAHTGDVAWRKRDYKKSNLVRAGEKLIILDEDGWLMLATATPEDLTIHSKVKLLEHQAWTAPTLIGTTLYLRDRKTMMALDLGERAQS